MVSFTRTRKVTASRWLDADPALMIPQLWSLAMAEAHGSIVAITTAHFLPAPNWIAAMHELHARHDAVGIGGPIDPPRGGGATDWATYFLRYSNYFHLDREQEVRDIAGDNASYKRASLEAHRDAIADGFWEPDFHRLVLAEGKTLRFSPAIRMMQHASFGVRLFCAQRLHHGREFGASRVRGKGLPMRLLRAASGVLVPFVLLGKIVLRVLRSRRDFWPFLKSLPVLVTFILAWTLGEVAGYLSFRKTDGLADEDQRGIK